MGIYRLVLKLRHRAYDKGKKPSEKAALPTICVGNVTVGGTGKTPHVELILRMLGDREGLAVLSRGYKRKSKGYLDVETDASATQVGDEPLQIAHNFPGVRVAVDSDRLEGCAKLAERGARLVILDDAFQYRRLQADLNIVLVDYSRPVFHDHLLPFGSLRDLPERIFEADIIIVTKCPPVLSAAEKAEILGKLRLSDRAQDVFFTSIAYDEPQMAFPEGNHRYAYAERLIVLSGIARNSTFRNYLGTRYKLQKVFSFPDHHAFTKRDIERLIRATEKIPTAGIATTQKDLQRLLACPYVTQRLKERLFAVPIEAYFIEEGARELFLARLENPRQAGI